MCAKKLEIPFTNEALDQLSFDTPGRLEVNFENSKSFIRGISLLYTPGTQKKQFVLKGKLRGKTFTEILGSYPEKYTTETLFAKYQEIASKCKKGNTWLRHPKEILRLSQVNQVVPEGETIQFCIEKLLESEFPRKNLEGNISPDTAQTYSRYLCGYNPRLKQLEFTENEKGWGQIKFKHKSINDFPELFKQFSPGVGLAKDQVVVSLYDSGLALSRLRDVSYIEIEEFMNSNHKSWGNKKNFLRAFSTLWNFARSKHYLGKTNIPRDPAKDVELKRPQDNNSVASLYNDLSYNAEDIPKIINALIKLTRKEPFRAECLMLLISCPIRISEACKLKWSDIAKDENGNDIIKLSRYVAKGRSRAGQKDEIIDITWPVQRVLERVKRHHKRKGFIKYKYIPYIFASTRADLFKLLDTDRFPKYAESKICRVSPRTLDDTYKKVKKITGLVGGVKTLRKTFITYADEILNGIDTHLVTRHKTKTVPYKHYIKKRREKVRQLNEKVVVGLFDKYRKI